MDIQSILNQVPDYQRFLTVDEMDQHTLALAQKYPEAASVFKAGESQKGHPIYCLKIGQGSHNALIMGCPHPNEPIGAMMLEFFTEQLCLDKALLEELDFTWYIVKTADPDGVKLNEGWFAGPYTLYNYARNFYRPASHQQVEWTFPLDYKTLHFHSPLPETQALMKIIEEKKPEFLYSLHNSAFGGAYWYISHENQQLIDTLPLAAAHQQIPLSLGEPEMPCCKVYSNAVFEFIGMPQMYDFYEEMTGQDPAGMLTGGSSSVDYANKQGKSCFGLVCEMPYFLNNEAMDTSDSDITRLDASLENCRLIEDLYGKMAPLVKEVCAYLPKSDAYRLALEERMATWEQSLIAQKNFAMQNPEFLKLATKAQKFDNVSAIPFYHVLGVGMIASGAEKVMEADPSLKASMTAVLNAAEAILQESCQHLEETACFEVIPIRKLVSVQLESGLLAAKRISEELNGNK